MRMPTHYTGFAALLLGATTGCDNPERASLERQKARLEAQILEKQAITNDLERYQKEVSTLTTQITRVERLVSPKIPLLAEGLKEHGVELTVTSSEAQDGFHVVGFKLTGPDRKSFAMSFFEMSKVPFLVRPQKLEVGETTWSGTFTTYRANLEAPKEEVEPQVAAPWFGWVNNELRDEVEKKKLQLQKLDDEVGKLGQFAQQKAQLQSFLKMMEQVMSGGPTHMAILMLFAGDAPSLKNGQVSCGKTSTFSGILNDPKTDEEEYLKPLQAHFQVVEHERSAEKLKLVLGAKQAAPKSP